jgi:hypothetical protein
MHTFEFHPYAWLVEKKGQRQRHFLSFFLSFFFRTTLLSKIYSSRIIQNVSPVNMQQQQKQLFIASASATGNRSNCCQSCFCFLHRRNWAKQLAPLRASAARSCRIERRENDRFYGKHLFPGFVFERNLCLL